MNDGGWTFDAKDGWHLHPSQEARVRACWTEAKARIEERQSRLPTCALCGERTLRLDKHGLCQRVTDTHQSERKRLAAHSPTTEVRS